MLQPGSEALVDELTDEDTIPHSINGSKEAKQYQTPVEMATNNVGLDLRHSQTGNYNRTYGRNSIAGQQPVHSDPEWIEMAVRNRQRGNHTEDENKIVESKITNEPSVTLRHRASVPNLNNFTQRPATDQLRYNTTGSHNFLLDGLPDVDYPINEDSTLYPHYQPVKSNEGSEFLGRQEQPLGQRRTLRRGSDSPSVNQDSRRNSSCSQSEGMETSPDAWSCSKNLKSPGLRKRRPVNTNQDPSSQMSKQSFPASRQSWTALNNYSSSNSDSDTSMKRNSLPSSSSSDSHRVLKLGSLKPNQGMFWKMEDRDSPDHHTFSEPELPDFNVHSKKPKLRTQRSSSIPNAVTDGSREFPLHSSNVCTSPSAQETPHISGHSPNGQPSPLMGYLEKAKERDRGGKKRDKNVKVNNPPPSFSTTPSPSPSDGDRYIDLKQVQLMRHRALTVSEGWREQLVDGDDDDKRNRFVGLSFMFFIS